MMPLTSDVSAWPGIFGAAKIDYIPDPMVLRAAELFIGGKQYCTKEQNLDAEKAWPVIENNIDGILAFFHVLMTWERVPFIDYEYTFPSYFFTQRLGELAEPIHPPHDVYTFLKSDALQKLQSFDSSRLPVQLVADLGSELFAVGYSWLPSLDDLPIGEADKKAASFILGGLIFGGYAQASGTDHLLQNKRACMFVALSQVDQMSIPRGIKRERRLFATLNRLANKDEHLSVELEEAPPNVLPSAGTGGEQYEPAA